MDGLTHGPFGIMCLRLAIMVAALVLTVAPERASAKGETSGTVVTLDGEDWLVATDPSDVGREQRWWEAARPGAKPVRVPADFNDLFPGYHGLVWYWTDFTAPANPDPAGRYLIRVWNADYKADVWVNGKCVGGHEGADGAFALDASEAVKPNAVNRLAIRLLNPTDQPIDGIVLKQTPHRNKTLVHTYGCGYDSGGLEDSVELMVCPAVRIADLFVHPDPATGAIRVQTKLTNTLARRAKGCLEITVSPAAGGASVATKTLREELPKGDSTVETQVDLLRPRLWQLSDPYLYRVTVRLSRSGSAVFDEQSTRCGFRDFRIAHGYFQLNGKRIFLRCSHTGNECPVGYHVTADHEWLRRDLLNVKAMGFNAIRFIAGLATRYQLDLCDEIGLMAYEEPYSAWLLDDSPHMAERFDRSTSDMILRDRNHPSVVIWGLLNETEYGPVFRHAVKTLPLVRSLDPDRLVLLSSGRFDRAIGVGSVANPGSEEWEYLLGNERSGAARMADAPGIPSPHGVGDFHIYPRVPHTAETIHALRTLSEGARPTFISEYGIATSVDLVRLARNFEQRSEETSETGAFYRRALDLFMADWARWRMSDTFGRPEDYFQACLARNAGQRLLGINAIRANPNINGYSLTGTVDQGYSGEGLTTTFRELKPGTFDAVFDGFAPLRWCLFAEPVNCYRGTPVTLDAVLATEDVLKPGEYPARVEVFGPNAAKVFEKRITVRVPVADDGAGTPFALPVFSQELTADWPSGKYRLVATLERGGAAAGGETDFYVADPADMPTLDAEVVLWGDDPPLAQWLAGHGVKVRAFASGQTGREVILVGNQQAAGGAQAFRELAEHIGRGATAIFLSPGVFAEGDRRTALVPLANKGNVVGLASCIYHKDEWAANHPIFAGLPTGLMDYTFYRETIPNVGWVGLDTPEEAVAGAIHASPAYESGLMMSVHRLGAGRVVLNTLLIRETLGKSPVAERLLRNLLIYASKDAAQPLADLPPDLIAGLNLR